MHKQAKLGLLLFVIGFAGILSALTIDMPGELLKEVLETFTPPAV